MTSTTASPAVPAPARSTRPTDADVRAQALLDQECEELAARMEAREGETDAERLMRQAETISEACGTDPMTGEPYYTAADVLSWVDYAVNEKDCLAPRFGPALVRRLFKAEAIPNARLRERFEYLRDHEGLSAAAVAVAIGEVRKGGQMAGTGDASRVERLLGIVHLMERGNRRLRVFLPYEKAVAIADALGMEYHDLGL